MKVIIVLVVALCALVVARPQDSSAYTESEDFDNIGIDGYRFK